jgi:disulfide bond formation protein DsbB|tara:strand:+ start:46 stop:528 length:483 start_codon:yes stop_codon:yes gene_type:complete
MTNIKNKKLLSWILIFCFFSLSFAYFVEFILGHAPCNLCLIQRIPYLAGLILIPIMFFLNKYEKIVSIILACLFGAGFLVSFYHFGIEQGFFNESFVCNLENTDEVLDAKQLLKKLNNLPVSCKNVTFRVLGISLATINTIISLALAAIIVKKVIINDKN